MKSIKKLLVGLIASFLLVACNQKTNEMPGGTEMNIPTTKSAVDDTLRAYAMPTEKTSYIFSGEGYYSDWVYYYDYMKPNYIQRKMQADDLSIGELLTYKDDEMRMISGIAPYKFIHDMTADEPYLDLLILKGPFIVGTQWVKEDSSLRKAESSITAIDKEITIPLGTYKAMEVTTSSYEKEAGITVESKEYYVKDLGFVMFEETGSPQGDRLTQLTEMKADQALTLPIYFFFPDDSLDFDVKEYVIETNIDMKELLSSGFKDFEAEKNIIFAPEDEILGLSFDLFTDRVIVNLSQSFLDNQRKNDNEEATLHALVNTLAVYYNVNYVDILIEGSPYESDKIVMDEGYYFTIDERFLEAEDGFYKVEE